MNSMPHHLSNFEINVLLEHHTNSTSLQQLLHLSMQIFNTNPTVLFSLETGGNWLRYSYSTIWVLFHIKPCFKLIYFIAPSPFSHKYLVSYDRYFKSKLNEYIIENFEWGLNVQLREHCATSVKTKFSRNITQILPFCDNFYTYRCGFLMPTKRLYFHWKRVETGDDILQIL